MLYIKLLIFKKSKREQINDLIIQHKHLGVGNKLNPYLRYNPRALESPKSWGGLQDNPGISFAASLNGLSRIPFRDTPNTCLTSAAFCSQRVSKLLLLYLVVSQSFNGSLLTCRHHLLWTQDLHRLSWI